MSRGDFVGAMSDLCEARRGLELCRKPLNASITLLMGDALIQTDKAKDVSALSLYMFSLIWHCKKSGRLLVAASLQRIGDLFYSAYGDIDTAESCWTATFQLIEHLQVNRHLGGCLVRLGIAKVFRRNFEDALDYFKRALCAFERAEAPAGQAYCRKILDSQDIESQPVGYLQCMLWDARLMMFSLIGYQT